jgi:bifunctional UDP-N-acetylglucosamine pyrophosphorylase / glucosamine-1-phosphate N-acetyltransferase
VSDARPAAVVVLAAGEGTRMRSATPKVLHELGGRSMLGHVVAAARGLEPDHLVVVVGHARERVTEALAALDAAAVPVVQEEQRGTGHAVRVALEGLPDLAGTVVVVPGDAPLLTTELLQELVTQHATAKASTTLLTAVLDDPTGYGRVVRDGGSVRAVVEHRDADAATLQVREVATSVYAFDAVELSSALATLTTDNAQGEEYLTDVVGTHRDKGLTVAAVVAPTATDTMGVNDRLQLAEAARLLRDRVVARHLRAGVAVLDPTTTWIDDTVAIEPDAVVEPGTQLRGATVVRRGAVVGPDTTLTSTVVGEGARVVRSHCERAEVGDGATVGPFSFLRPGAVLGAGAKVGAYVEVKGSTIGAGSKVPHLSYIGDTTIGERTNIGAGTITFNYDGVAKHRTTIGSDAKVGGNNSLVAPIEIGDGAYTAAGSALTRDVPAGALGVGRAQQRNVEGWAARRSQSSDDQGETQQ